MTSEILGIYGTGGCGRGIMPLARQQYPDHRLVFVDDTPTMDYCNAAAVMTFGDFAANPKTRIALAVAQPAVRRQLAEKCARAGVSFLDVAAQDLIVMDNSRWGPGALLSPRVTITSNVRIGAHFHGNLHSYVEHDCVIGDFVTFGPGVRCNGAVTIGSGAYIGSGAMIRQGITIGANAVVGMGAVVVKDVAAGVTVAGNPARPLA